MTTRLQPDINQALAQFRPLAGWTPQDGDFIIWHGWIMGRWYGVVNQIEGDKLYVIKESLPKLLFTMAESDYEENTIHLSAGRIRQSVGGEYHILQSGVWFIDG